MNRSGSVSWGWFVLALLLSLSMYWGITALFTLSIEAYLFLPILTGWLASRHGPGVVGLLLALGLLTVFEFRLEPLDSLDLTLGVPLYVDLLAVCSAIAFAEPHFAGPESTLFHDRWRWLKWLLVPAIGIAIFSDWRLEWEPGDWLLVSTNVGLVLTGAILVAAINWSVLLSAIDRVVPTSEPRWRQMAKMFWAGIFAMGFLLATYLEIGRSSELLFGSLSLMPVFVALAFVLPASGIVDWKVAIVFLVALFAADWLVYWAADAIEAAMSFEPSAPPVSTTADQDSALEEILVSATRIGPANFPQPSLIAAVSATLLAVALGPFWRHRDASVMHQRRSAIFLFLSLALFLAGIAFSIDDFMPIIFGGIAFGMGLIWQVRGVIGAPPIIMIGYLLALVLTHGGYYATGGVYRVVNIGLIVFPFAYLGLLSNRYSASEGSADNGTAKTGAGT